MSKQTINIGASPNDGTGTPLRTSFDYTNQNFTELYTALGGGVGLPGATTQVIFNDGGTNLAGDAGLVYNKTTDALTVAGLVTAGSATITGALTVATSALKVDSTTGRVAINTATFASGSIGVIQSSATRSAGFIFNNSVGTYSGTIGLDAAGSGGGSQNVTVLAIGTDLSLYSGNALQHKISNPGVFNWYDGLGGTRMTLNSTGLGIGVSPAFKLHSVGIAAATDSIYNGTYGTLIGAMLNSDDANFGANPGVDLRRFTGTAFNHGLTYIATNATGDTLFYNGTAASNTRATSLKMTLDGSGNLLVNTTSQILSAKVSLKTDGTRGYSYNDTTGSAGTKAIIFGSLGVEVGSVSVTTLATTYNTTSDYRLKESVQPLVGGLTRINSLKPSIYNWKSNGSAGEGFIAHELADVVPAAVTGKKDAVNEDGTISPQSIDMSRIVPILVAAIQELTARVQTLEAR